MIKTNRRELLRGLLFVAAAPAIVRIASIMPVRAIPEFDFRRMLYRYSDYVIEGIACNDMHIAVVTRQDGTTERWFKDAEGFFKSPLNGINFGETYTVEFTRVKI